MKQRVFLEADVVPMQVRKKLRENLLSSGKPEPAYKNAAHHIVAGSSPKAAEARAILKKYNIDILDMIREKLLAGIF